MWGSMYRSLPGLCALLLVSIVISRTAHFTLAHRVWRGVKNTKGRLKKFTHATWACDGQQAIVEGRGDHDGFSLNIRCPQTDAAHGISNVTVHNYTFNVKDHVQCEINHPLKQPNPNVKVVAAVMMYEMDLHMAFEWIE